MAKLSDAGFGEGDLEVLREVEQLMGRGVDLIEITAGVLGEVAFALGVFLFDR